MSGKKRKELRRQANRLSDLGTAAFADLPVSSTHTDGIKTFLRIESEGWKSERAGGFPLARSEGEARFFTEAMIRGAFEGQVLCTALTLNDAPKALLFSLRTGGRLSAFKTTYDESLGAYSPGVRLLIEATRRMLDCPETHLFDSCARQDHPVVDRLWPERLPIAQINVPTRHASDKALLACAATAERWKDRVTGLTKPPAKEGKDD